MPRTPTGEQLHPFDWTNDQTEDLVRWLIEDVVGAEFVNTLRTPAVSEFDVDTPTHTLGETIRDVFVEAMPLPVDPAWLETIDWNQVAQYLIQHVPVGEECEMLS